MLTRKNHPFVRRARFALARVRHAARTERSLLIQSLVLAWVVIVLARLQPSPLWSALVTLSGIAVLAAAVERLAGHLHPEMNPEIRLLKHCAGGTVLIAWVGALGVAIALLIGLLRGPR